MEIKILHLINGARQARGLAVIIDVFRAFSSACYVFGNGAKKIIPLADINAAYGLKKENSDFLLIGERDGKKPQGFDYGNSPTEIEKVDFTNKTVIQTTSAGTQGIANATAADEIIAGGFVNAQATIDYIKKAKTKEVSLVAMGGKFATVVNDEDVLCAEYIKNSLEGKKNNFLEIISRLRRCRSAQKFFDPTKGWAAERDFDLCLALDKFNFILKVEPCDKGYPFFRKIIMQ